MKESSGIVTDSEFEEFVKSGNSKIFRKFYDQYIGLIQFIARKYLRQRQEADDIVQEVFTRFFRERSKLEKQSAIKSWLAITARNLAIDYLRKQQQAPLALSESNENNASGESKKFESREALKIELSIKVVRETLTALAESGKAEEMKLYYLDGMKTADIATRLGVSVSTVTTNLTRQRRKYSEELKKKIEEQTETCN